MTTRGGGETRNSAGLVTPFEPNPAIEMTLGLQKLYAVLGLVSRVVSD